MFMLNQILKKISHKSSSNALNVVEDVLYLQYKLRKKYKHQTTLAISYISTANKNNSSIKASLII